MKFPEQRLDLSSFGKGKKILSPYTSWLTVRVLVQLERITFRAVLIFLRTALLVCSESDTFLKNYIFDLIFIFFLYFSTREISPLCFYKFISIFLLLFNNFSVNFYAILRAIVKGMGVSTMQFKTEKISEHITRIHGFCTEFMYLIEGSKAAVLIDTGCGFYSLKDCIHNLTNKPLKVLITHGHVDHAMGANEF